jgi:hypothetical protein
LRRRWIFKNCCGEWGISLESISLLQSITCSADLISQVNHWMLVFVSLMVVVASLHPTPRASSIEIGAKRRRSALFVLRTTCWQGSAIPAKTVLLNVPTTTVTASAHQSRHKSSFCAWVPLQMPNVAPIVILTAWKTNVQILRRAQNYVHNEQVKHARFINIWENTVWFCQIPY